MLMEMKIKIPEITINWSDWTSLKGLNVDYRKVKRDSSFSPSGSGVYQVRSNATVIYIGKSLDLDRRVRCGLAKGTIAHCNRENILRYRNLTVRWARTDRISAVEEDLLIQHKKSNGGKLPLCNKQG
jgi:hypothetical protein